jgi:hypothetical protein
MLAVDQARELDCKWRQEKEKAGTQGVGLVVEKLPRGSVSLALIAASPQSRPRRDHVQAS